MKTYYIYDIDWDTDGEDIKLPTELTIEMDIADDLNLDEELGDWLSNEYGFCHFGFNYEIIS